MKLSMLLLCCLLLTGCRSKKIDPWISASVEEEKFGVASATPCEASEPLQSHPSRPLDTVALIDIALRNNPSTKKAWAEVRAATFNVEVAKSVLYPTLSAQETLVYSDFKLTHPAGLTGSTSFTGVTGAALPKAFLTSNTTPPNVNATAGSSGIIGPPGYNKFVSHNILASYVLMDFGGRAARIDSARQALYSMQWQRYRTIQIVIVNVMQNYYNYMGFKALLEAKYIDLKEAEENYKAAEKRFEVGVVRILDVYQTRSALVNVQLSIVQLHAQEQTTWGALMTTLGMSANSKAHVEEFPENIPLDYVDLDVKELILLAETKRPDLEAAFANYRQAEAEVLFAQSAGLPILSAEAIWQRNVYFNNPALNHAASAGALTLNVPIFSGFLYVNQTRVAKARARSAFEDYETLELTVTLDVVTSYANYKAALESYRFSEELMKFTQQAYEAAYTSYREGTASILDLLLAQQNLSEARAQKIQARTAWGVALANIAFATGEL